MKVITITDSAVLMPNKEHQNFTDSGVVIPSGNILEGESKKIDGLRRGKPFTYKIFHTNNNQFIYLNTIKPMETTEVTLGADSSQSATKVNLIPAEMYTQDKLIGVIVGGVAGFLWAKYKKHDMKRVAMYIGSGAVVGYAAAYFLDTRKNAIVKSSK
tara:strand:- start:880 stop:1350 length:471 start_codon:yes stop_codon:yes gene_type:complete